MKLCKPYVAMSLKLLVYWTFLHSVACMRVSYLYPLFYFMVQGTLGALIVGNLASRGLISLDLFASLPEDNEFAFSPR